MCAQTVADVAFPARLADVEKIPLIVKKAINALRLCARPFHWMVSYDVVRFGEFQLCNLRTFESPVERVDALLQVIQVGYGHVLLLRLGGQAIVPRDMNFPDLTMRWRNVDYPTLPRGERAWRVRTVFREGASSGVEAAPNLEIALAA